VSGASAKKESYEMAMQLLLDKRIFIETAVYALKETGHTRGEVELFLEEYKQRDKVYVANEKQEAKIQSIIKRRN
jgi:TRAP-type mannitol/chloroaromatic compound transport system permease small subunit